MKTLNTIAIVGVALLGASSCASSGADDDRAEAGVAEAAEPAAAAQDQQAASGAEGMEAFAGMDPAMMAEMMKMATPGPAHEKLAGLVGDWEQSYRFRMSPEADWMDTTGTSTMRSAVGGRYVIDDVQFDLMGMPVLGLHMLGYDNRSDEFVSLWADSNSTWWVTARGKEREDGVIEMRGKMSDAAGDRDYRMLIDVRDDGTVYTEMFDTYPDAGENKVMEIHAKRKN